MSHVLQGKNPASRVPYTHRVPHAALGDTYVVATDLFVWTYFSDVRSIQAKLVMDTIIYHFHRLCRGDVVVVVVCLTLHRLLLILELLYYDVSEHVCVCLVYPVMC